MILYNGPPTTIKAKTRNYDWVMFCWSRENEGEREGDRKREGGKER